MNGSAASISMCFFVALPALLQVLCVSAKATGHSTHTSEHHRHSKSDRRHISKPKPAERQLLSSGHAAGRSTCSPLVNHGTHFTVEIEVGTPGQKFAVVADTGSDAIIVPSCACVKAGYCSPKSRCFVGTNRSSTFAIEEGPEGPPTIRMMFGSGPVQAVVASDTVSVGGLHTKMKDGLLLMTDQLLNIKGEFEGILGLGLPSAEAKKGLYRQHPPSKPPPVAPAAGAEKGSKYVGAADQGKGVATPVISDHRAVNIFPFPSGSDRQTKDTQGLGDTTVKKSSAKSPLGDLAPTEYLSDFKKPGKHEKTPQSANSSELVVKGFVEEAGVKRFSMCFNDGANGVLRLGSPKAKRPHGSIGQVHWGLDFRGISVGKTSAPVQFCQPGNMSKGQKTPCGAIPDSGTTALMAPKEHLVSLYESICDDWDRCKKNHTAMVKAAEDAKASAITAFNVDPFHIQPASKAVIFQQLILDCRHWLTTDKGLNELPGIHFHIGGANGTKQTLKLGGWSYIIETQDKEFKYIYKEVPGLGKLPVGKNFTGEAKKVCSPAFSTMEYSTEQNGPVWILGTPIFYEYQVGYDMEAKPPSMSFSDTPCGSCGGISDTKPKTSLLSESNQKDRRVRQPRQVDGPARMPNFDLTGPL